MLKYVFAAIALYLAYSVAEDFIHNPEIIAAKKAELLQRAYQGY